MSANTSCPSASIPADLPIPNNVTYTVIPGTNISDPWMVNCCAPNPVHIVSDCWEWCEITSDMASFNISSPDDHTERVNAAFGTCLTFNNRPLNESNGVETHAKNSAADDGRRISEKGSARAVTWLLLLGHPPREAVQDEIATRYLQNLWPGTVVALSEMNASGSTSMSGQPLDEAFSKRYTTCVKSSLIPRFREQAPSLDELCTGLVGTLDGTTPWKSSSADEKSLRITATPVSTIDQNEKPVSQESQQSSTACEASFDQARLEERLDFDNGLCEAFPEFSTYAHLDALSEHPFERLRAIATKIKEIQLRWMDEERVEATWVTPNILLDGILGSMDPKTLQALCETHGFKNVVMVSLHPDDWVAGAVWKAHGRLKWIKRPSSAQEQASGVYERLISPLFDQSVQNPQIIVQNGVEYQSPVIDQLIIPLEDGDGSSLLTQLPDICTFVSQHNRPDTLIVLHCKMGLSRSNAGQEAFVLHAVYQELRKHATWMKKDSNEKRTDLQTICQAYHKSVQQRRPALKSKFPNQMANWAKYLADGEPECGPDFAIDKTSPGGNDMRDAAITACYELGYLLPPNLISHYYKRTEVGSETARKTIGRFQNAEQEMNVAVKTNGLQDATSWVPIVQYVTLCKAIHKSTSLKANVKDLLRPSKLE